MKKFLAAIGILLVLLVASAFILPAVFKDDIKVAIDEELEKSVNATVLFDVDNFSLSMFKNFPSITATLSEFGVVNREPFDGEVLFFAEELEVEINLFSLFGDTPSLSGITLIEPIINIKVLEDGSANYDIAISTAEESTEETPAEEFSFRIDHWEVINGDITYDDATIPFYLNLTEVNHTGSGDFTLDQFDLKTQTSSTGVTVGYDGDTYMEGQTVEMDAVISISDDISRYTFKENSARVNDFNLTFDGWFFMADDYYDMDITYGAADNTFKSLLSLVPGMYSEEFSDLTAAGEISFAGAVKGKYDDTSMPAFNVALDVKDGMFQYPDLPTAVENISLDMKVDNPDGVIENTRIDINQFHMGLGSNPIDAKLLIKNLKDYDTQADISAHLNLAELSQMFPVEGLEMRGNFDLDLKAEGSYDSTLNTMPVLSSTMALKDGYIKSSEFPIPLEDFHFSSTLSNSTGNMSDFVTVVEDLTLIMDEEEFHADLTFSDLINYTWKAKVAGGIDLEKITSLIPLEGMELAGRIVADIETSGNYEALEAEQYNLLPTSGNMKIENFVYKDVTLPYDVTIESASASLTPTRVALESYEGHIGKSDLSMSGEINNYMGFIFSEDELLKGTFDFKSGYMDLNQLMPEYEEDTTAIEEEEVPYSAIPVPKNIDFVMNASISNLHYMDMDIRNVNGRILVRDGIVRLQNLNMNFLGGAIMMAGDYNTQNPEVPGYDFLLKVSNISIKESFETFTIVKNLAPVAAHLIGDVSTDFKIKGDLGQDLMPKLETITGAGVLRVVDVAFGNKDVLDKLSAVTSLEQSNSVSLKNIAMSTSIENGKLAVKPFNLTLGDYPATISGATGIDGSIDYSIKLDVPASKLGDNLTSLTSSLGLGQVDPNSTIPVNIGMGGTYRNPTMSLLSSGAKDQIKDNVTSAAKEEGQKLAKDLVESLGDSGKSNVIGTLLNASDSTSGDSTSVQKQATDKAKEALNNLLKNRKKKKNN